jgi:SAM-dependent methyltransferase
VGVTVQEWMEPGRRRDRAGSFGPAASLYDRVRPSYPQAAVAWALQPLGAPSARVVDLGAGTGIMTRLLLAEGHDVIAVEPDAQMRQVLGETSPGVDIRAGSAESIPVGDAEVDAVVAAQAYHWFDPERAHAEIGRVIRPGGVFAAIWNDRDEATDWVLAYSHIVEGDRAPDGSGADTARAAAMSFGDLFAPVETHTVRHEVPFSPAALVDLLKSRSYYLTAPPDRQAHLEREVRRLTETHPDLAGRTEFALPYLTRIYRAVRHPGHGASAR